MIISLPVHHDSKQQFSWMTFITKSIYSIAADAAMAVQYEDGRIGPRKGGLMLLQLPDSMGNGKSRRGKERDFRVHDSV
jgi:hypothetical protein